MFSVRPGLVETVQGDPQSEHSLASVVGGFVPQTTFKGVPPEFEDAAADILFLTVLPRMLVDMKLPVKPPLVEVFPGMGPVGWVMLREPATVEDGGVS